MDFRISGALDGDGLAFDQADRARGTLRSRRTHRRALSIGLVNNMPDTAVDATERQFASLIAATGVPIEYHLFAIDSVPRSVEMREEMARRYHDISVLPHIKLDGLIVSGTEPRAAHLSQEPYWSDIATLVEHAAENTLSTIWSCLAAHLAVLRLDGIERRRLAAKCSGMFACERVDEHSFLGGCPTPLTVAHSRLNVVDEDVLTKHGYSILSRSEQAGVDIFEKRFGSRFVFFQGHPEYDETSLLREFRRDVGRYISGDRDSFPDAPKTYFDAATETAILEFRARAEGDRQSCVLADLPQLSLRAGLAAEARASAAAIFEAWTKSLAEEAEGFAAERLAWRTHR